MCLLYKMLQGIVLWFITRFIEDCSEATSRYNQGWVAILSMVQYLVLRMHIHTCGWHTSLVSKLRNLLYYINDDCLFVCHTSNSVISAWINIGFGLCRAMVSGT